ncbi:MAG: hypothetical protein MUF13_02460 [Akkermansiaceae bacterium]|jgi:DNA repair exonuclease SbcCD ATPase subunit|nr:hypothetical protein [Akkermansiaceae bacterium]
MISNSDNSGLFSFMVGIIVLVLAAVGLSLLVDKRFNFSSSMSSLNREIESGASELEHLKVLHDHSAAELAKVEPMATRNAEELSSLRQSKAALSGKQKQLAVTSAELTADIEKLEQDFSSYRDTYRNKVRTESVGRKLGDMTLKNGREYKNATIVEVTDVGLEIRHDAGTARIQAPDLDPAMQDLYQWDHAERAKRLSEEEALRHSIGAAPGQAATAAAPAIKRNPAVKPGAAPAGEDVAKIREKVRAWSLKVSQLEIERSQASINASSSGRNGGPGGLETWREKADRLVGELARARTQLAAARAELSLASPDDPLLRPPHPRY